MKQKLIKIYSFDRMNIFDGKIISENLNANIVSISESFFTLAYECYKHEKLQDEQLIYEIIKVMLPCSEEDANKEWNDGLTFNGKKYFAWLATTSGMKKETLNGKCETIFIREDFYNFANEFENLISLGKFKEIENSKEEICINKDILSRISLGLSSSQMVGDMPNIIILPQPKFKIIKDYKTVEIFITKVENKKGEMEDITDYKLVDYSFNEEIDVFDGGAIATPKVFNQIKTELGLNYSIEFAIIRGYGIGIKGMVTKFDILRYLSEVYKDDTCYCKKINDKFYLMDYWGEWQLVTDNIMLLNESMVKLAKYYDTTKNENMNTYKERLAMVEPKFKDIIRKLYVTKVNKSDDNIGEYRRLNYQFLSALALSKKDYYQLISEDGKSYSKILVPFQKDSEKSKWQINIDNIRIFLKNIVSSNDQDDEEFGYEVKKLNENIMNKCEELLNISEDFVHLKNIRRNLAGQIEKRCRDLACGKITAKATYKYIAVDPISYINFALYRDQGENGLNEGEFYSSDCNNGNVRTVARNPLCAYSEIHNLRFVRNQVLDDYLSPCRELIYFNQKSDILALMSSADCDGDACTVVDNDTIRAAVVVPKDGKYFLNKDDGHKEKMVYNAENRFLASYRASGNLIGKIALKSASINSNSQQTLDYYDTNSKCFILYSDIDKEDETIKKAFVEEKLKSDEWLTTYDAGQQHREHIKQRFYDNEKDIYTVLYNAMVSIDAPKTLYFPSPEDMKIINDKYSRKAWFLRFKEDENDINNRSFQWTNGLLDVVAKYVVRDRLLSEIESINAEFKDRASLIQQKLINGDYNNVEEYNPCVVEVETLYKDYSNAREKINKEYSRKIREEKQEKKLLEDNFGWSEVDDEFYYKNIEKYKQEKKRQYKEIDAQYIQLASEIIKKYELATIANVIGNMKNCTEDFIINLFWPVFEYLNLKLQTKRYVYQKSDDGDIFFLHEKFRKIELPAIENRYIIKKLDLEEKRRLNVIKTANIRAKVIDESAIGIIESELDTNGFIWLNVEENDGQVYLHFDDKNLLQPFSDHSQINEFNLSMLKKIKVELLDSKAKKSIGVIVTEIEI